MKDFMFTSESVTEGHPDKLCDQISDAVVDRFLTQDPYSRVRVECAISSAIIFIAARFASRAVVDLTHAARKVVKRTGYDQPDFNEKICSILTSPQALPIDEGSLFREDELSEEEMDRIAVKHQVTLFGFACNQTPNLMPLPVHIARRLTRRITSVRNRKILSYLMPDAKVQVGVEFRNRIPARIHSITVTASQKNSHDPSQQILHDDIMDAIIKPVFKEEVEIRPDAQTRILINPDGPFLGGPTHHSGLTGRKNAVDTYGEYARLSGNALSGKDPMRIDRSGAYAARYAAKNIVAAGLASECEVMLSYSIGLTRPVSLIVQTFGTGKRSDQELTDLVRDRFDFRL